MKYLTITIVHIASHLHYVYIASHLQYVYIAFHLVTILRDVRIIFGVYFENGAVVIRIFYSGKYLPCHLVLADSQSTD